ncbi:hypothetical protein RHIZ404_200003 [Rhizobium sp. EC-SD404]|nr:hypothetical protein RHIZ404_200003 [Rhizobium sp. EC-SD404]
MRLEVASPPTLPGWYAAASCSAPTCGVYSDQATCRGGKLEMVTCVSYSETVSLAWFISSKIVIACRAVAVVWSDGFARLHGPLSNVEH